MPSLALGLPLPPNDGFLTDATGILTTEEELNIEEILQNYAQENGTEIAVVLVQNVSEGTIEDGARDIATRWRVGVDEGKRGVVLLFSYEDRDLFMMIGDGLQGVLSPDIAQGIIERDVIPLFRGGKYAEGIKEGVMSIIKHISGQYTSERYVSSPPSILLIWLAIIVAIVGGVIVIMLVRQWWQRDPSARRRRRR